MCLSQMSQSIGSMLHKRAGGEESDFEAAQSVLCDSELTCSAVCIDQISISGVFDCTCMLELICPY